MKRTSNHRRKNSRIRKFYGWFRKTFFSKARENFFSKIVKGSLISLPGQEHIIFEYKPVNPCMITGFIEFPKTRKGDILEIQVYVRIDEDYNLYLKETHEGGVDEDKVKSFSRMVVVGDLKVIIKQTAGIRNRVNYLFLRELNN